MTADNGTVVARGEQVVACAPHQTVDVALGRVALPRDAREAYLNLSWTPNHATAFVQTTDEVAYDQFVLEANPRYEAKIDLPSGRSLKRDGYTWSKRPGIGFRIARDRRPDLLSLQRRRDDSLAPGCSRSTAP